MRTSIPIRNTAAQPTPVLRRSQIASGAIELNWPLLILIFAMPLKNIYMGKFPDLGDGINFLNIMLLSAFAKWKTRPQLSAPSESLVHGPLCAFMALLAISAIYGIQFIGELGEKHLHILKDHLTPMFVFFIVINSVRDRRGIVATIVATCLPLPYMFYVFRAQYNDVASWHYDDDMRLVNGTFMDLGSNEIAAFYAAYTFILVGVLVYVKNWKARAALSPLIFMNLYCLMYSFSRGSWLSFLAGSAVLVWYCNKKLALAVGVAVALLGNATLLLLPESIQERAETIFVDEHEARDNSAESRYRLWEVAMQQYEKSPILGIGFHSYHHFNPYEGIDTHNYFVRVLTEQGAVGLLILTVVFWRSWRTGRELVLTTDDPLFKALGVGVLAIVTAFVVGNCFGDRFSHYPLSTYYWVYVALAARALIICQAKTANTAQARGATP